ncbi:MAG: lysylphosphatidylglycerol synthase transmembrane domain-containing protein [Coriobacteriia bacterium]
MTQVSHTGFRIKRSAIITTLVLLFAAAGLFVFFADIGKIGAVIRWFDLRYLPLIVALSLVKFLMWYVKWDYYLALIDVHIPRLDDILIYLSGFSLSLTPGKVGELLRSWIMQDQFGIPAEKTVPLTLMERATDALAMGIIACLTFSSVGSNPLVVVVVLAVLFAVLFVLRRRSWVEAVLRRLERVRFLARFARKLDDSYESTHAISGPRHNVYGIMNGLVSWVAEGLVFYFILIAVGSPIAIPQALFVTSVAAIVGAISSIPGGLIANELSAIAILTLIGVPPSVATAATLLARLSTLWLGVTLGTGAYALLRVVRPAVRLAIVVDAEKDPHVTD